MITGYATIERQVAQLTRDFRNLREREEEVRATGSRPPLVLARDLGLHLDPWQQEVLLTDLDSLLLVTRQGGKGMVATLLALSGLLDNAGSTTVIVGKSDRQSKRMLRRIKAMYHKLSNVPPPVIDSQYTFELRNGSEILALPGSEETVRGIEAVNLLIIDEASVVPDDLYSAVYPMLATTSGRCVALTTPRGKRGWFHTEWAGDSPAWHRTRITAHDIPRINPEWLERTRHKLGDWMFRQEFLCEFLDTEDQMFATDQVMAALRSEVAPLALPTIGGFKA